MKRIWALPFIAGLALFSATLTPYSMLPPSYGTMYLFSQDTAKKYCTWNGHPTGLFADPQDIAYAIGNPSIFVVDKGHNKITVIQIAPDGSIDTIINYGSGGNGENEFNAPTAITVLPNDFSAWYDYDIYVADTKNNRLVNVWYSYNDRRYEWKSTVNSTNEGAVIYFNNPKDVASFWDPSYKSKGGSAVYLLDSGNKRFIKYSAGNLGSPYYIYSGEDSNGVHKRFGYPTSIAIHPNHISILSYDIYICDPPQRKVIFLRETSTFSPPEWKAEIKFPEGKPVACATDGKAVYVLDNRNSKIIALAPDLSRTYFVFGGDGTDIYHFNFPANVACDSVDTHYRLGIIENYTPWSGFKTYTPDLSNIPDDKPDLFYHTYDGFKTVVLRFYDRCSVEDYYEIWKKRNQYPWFVKATIKAKPGQNYVEFVDTMIIDGQSKISYKVRGTALDYRTAFSDSFTITTPRCFPPTITSITFQDTIVKINWDDNSYKNMAYCLI